MKTMRRMAVFFGVLACATACTGHPSAPASNPANDIGLRQVPVVSGNALAWLRPETSAQVLCQTVSQQQWQEVFGAPVRRKASADACELSAGADVVTLSMVPAEFNWSDNTTVAGHPARRDSAGLTVSATGTDLDELQSSWPMRPLLKAQGGKSLNGVLDRLVPMLATPATMPMPKDANEFAYVHTPSPARGQFLDEPLPLQVLQLCSLLADQQHVAPEALHPMADGTCTADEPRLIVGVKKAEHPVSAYSAQVAGRPGIMGGAETSVRLRDDLPYDLTVFAYTGDALKLTEPMVTSLV